jgi:hypothetical protein
MCLHMWIQNETRRYCFLEGLNTKFQAHLILNICEIFMELVSVTITLEDILPLLPTGTAATWLYLTVATDLI